MESEFHDLFPTCVGTRSMCKKGGRPRNRDKTNAGLQGTFMTNLDALLLDKGSQVQGTHTGLAEAQTADPELGPLLKGASQARLWRTGRMRHKGSGQNFGRKRHSSRNNPKQEKEQEPVHRRNVQLAALPVILLFNLLRFLVFQIYLLVLIVYRVRAQTWQGQVTPVSAKVQAICNFPVPTQKKALMSFFRAGGILLSVLL